MSRQPCGVSSGTARIRLKDTAKATDAAFSPDGSEIVTSSLHGSARVFSTDGTPVAVLPGKSKMTSAAFSPDGHTVVTTDYGRLATIWAIPSGKPLLRLRGHESAVYD